MYKLSKQIICILIFISISFFVLDKIYVYIHLHYSPRNTADWIMSLDEKDSLDYVLLGSSRILHHVDPIFIKNKHNLKGYNFGIPGSSPFEIKLAAKSIIRKKITKKIFIQVDYIWNEILPAGEPTTQWFPYLNHQNIWNDFKKLDNPQYQFYHYIPFYRFIKNDAKLGFRELFLSFLGKEFVSIKNNGFIPEYGKVDPLVKTNFYTFKKEYNIHFKEIEELANQNNIQLFYFTAPIYNYPLKNKNHILKDYLPNYKDFSNSIDDSKLYKDQIHLNSEGAIEFTKIFMNFYFNQNS